jgi:precorrin-2 dehydrogenase/sirohydrochlorin ferrochelatase
MLTGARLVLACTDDAETNAAIAAAARRYGALVNRSDDPDGSDFHVPMRLQDGPVVVAISTGGASPHLSKRIRDSLTLPPGIGQYAQVLLELRRRGAREIPDQDHRAEVMRQLSTDEAFMLFLAEGAQAVKTLYENHRKRNHQSGDAL